MQKKDHNSKPLVFCHRLFNFIMNTIVPGRLKHLTMIGRPPVIHDTTEIHVEGSSMNGEQPLIPSKSNEEGINIHSVLTSEITVEFRHTNGFDQSLVQNGVNEKNIEKEKDQKDLILVQEMGASNGTSLLPIEEKTGSLLRGEGIQEKTLSMKDGEEKNKTQRQKNVSTVLEIEDIKMKLDNMPISSMISNINEKSEEFIRKRREAMSRSSSFGPRKS